MQTHEGVKQTQDLIESLLEKSENVKWHFGKYDEDGKEAKNDGETSSF